MKTNKILSIVYFIISMIFMSSGYAHPTGNMITVGENVLWSYINPISDTNHHACVMIWSKNSKPKLFIKSEFPGSDFMPAESISENKKITRYKHGIGQRTSN